MMQIKSGVFIAVVAVIITTLFSLNDIIKARTEKRKLTVWGNLNSFFYILAAIMLFNTL